jgi:hypothetical protein
MLGDPAIGKNSDHVVIYTWIPFFKQYIDRYCNLGISSQPDRAVKVLASKASGETRVGSNPAADVFFKESVYFRPF